MNYYNKYSKTNLNKGSSIVTYNNYDNLPTTELIDGQECIVTNINSSPSRAILDVKNGVWSLGVSDSQISYIKNNPKPQLSKTVPQAIQVDGCVPDINSSPSIGDMLANWGRSSNAATTPLIITNVTGQQVNKIKLCFMANEPNNAFISAKVKCDDSFLTSDGTWVSATFSGSHLLTNNGTSTSPSMVWSDWITLPTPLEAGQNLAIWITASGGSTLIMPLVAGFNYRSWKEATNNSNGGRISDGNGVAGETMDWIFFQTIIGLAKVAWGFTNTDDKVVNIAVYGDSTISMFDGWAATSDYGTNGYQGWAYTANKKAIETGKKYRVTSFGVGSIGIYEYRDLAIAGLSSFPGSFDILGFQPWSGNSPTTSAEMAAHLGVIAQVKTACDVAGVSFMPFQISLPAGGTWNGTGWDESLTPEQLACYWYIKSYMEQNYPSFLYVADSVADGTGLHYNQTDSLDDEHCLCGNVSDPVGQYKIGVAINNRITSKIQALGYSQ